MSWGEVKKINSDLTTPLNVLMWINELKMYGSQSYVCKSLDMLTELSKYDIVINDIVCKPLLVSAAHDNRFLGKFCKKLLKSENPEFDTIETLNQFVLVDSAITEVFSNENMAMLFHASTIFQTMARAGSTAGIKTLYNNDAFTNDIIAVPRYITQPSMSGSTWRTILDETNFMNKLLVPEQQPLLKRCLGDNSSGAVMFDGLARSPKGLSTFLKSNQPPDVLELLYSKYTSSGYGTVLKQTLGSTLYFSLKADQWDTAVTTVNEKTTYFNGTYPKGSNTINKPQVDTSFALLNEVKCSQSSAGFIKRLTHPDEVYLTYTGTLNYPANNVVIGGFVVEPSTSGYCILKYRIYVPK